MNMVCSLHHMVKFRSDVSSYIRTQFMEGIFPHHQVFIFFIILCEAVFFRCDDTLLWFVSSHFILSQRLARSNLSPSFAQKPEWRLLPNLKTEWFYWLEVWMFSSSVVLCPEPSSHPEDMVHDNRLFDVTVQNICTFSVFCCPLRCKREFLSVWSRRIVTTRLMQSPSVCMYVCVNLQGKGGGGCNSTWWNLARIIFRLF